MRTIPVEDMSKLTPSQLARLAELDHYAFGQAPFEEHRICVQRDCGRLLDWDTYHQDGQEDCPDCGSETEDILPMKYMPDYLAYYFQPTSEGPARGTLVLDNNGEIHGYNMAVISRLEDLVGGFGYRGSTDVEGLIKHLCDEEGLSKDTPCMHWNRTVLSPKAQGERGLFTQVCRSTFEQFQGQADHLPVVGETKHGGKMLPNLMANGYRIVGEADPAGWICVHHPKFGELRQSMTLPRTEFLAQHGTTLKLWRERLKNDKPVHPVRYPNMPMRMHEIFES